MQRSEIVLILFVMLFFAGSSKGQIISTFAGNGSNVYSGEGVVATSAGIPDPAGGIFDKVGNYYFADGANSNRIRKISTSGIITTVAGNGIGGFAGDGGQATSAKLNWPYGPKLDLAGNLYIPDKENNRIRKVDIATGIINTIAGTGIGGYNGDGIPATAAQLWSPDDVAIDKDGNIYVADMLNSRIRKINSAGIISTIAGNGTSGFSGDGGPATNAPITYPTGLTFDRAGNLYIADWSSFSNRVRKVNTSGIISTIAGNGSSVYSGDNIPATTAGMVTVSIAIDSFNNLYISDRYNHRVYRVNLSTGILHCIAGNGVSGDGGDGGAATAASLNYPVGIAVDKCANVYVTSIGNISISGSAGRIRLITFNPPPCEHLEVSASVVNVPISIYPNPAGDALHIDNVSEENTLSICDCVSYTIINARLHPGANEIDIHTLPAGIYLLVLQDKHANKTVRKFIKQ